MIIIMLIELLFVYILMRFIEEIGISGSMLFYAILNVISAVIASGFGVGTVLSAALSGALYGVCAFLIAKLFLFLIRVLGALGTIIVGALFVLAFLSIVGIIVL